MELNTLLKSISMEMQQVNKRLTLIEKQLEYNNKTNHEIKESTDHMTEHIQFVNTVYDKVRSPMDYIISSFTLESSELPLITQQPGNI